MPSLGHTQFHRMLAELAPSIRISGGPNSHSSCWSPAGDGTGESSGCDACSNRNRLAASRIREYLTQNVRSSYCTASTFTTFARMSDCRKTQTSRTGRFWLLFLSIASHAAMHAFIYRFQKSCGNKIAQSNVRCFTTSMHGRTEVSCICVKVSRNDRNHGLSVCASLSRSSATSVLLCSSRFGICSGWKPMWCTTCGCLSCTKKSHRWTVEC
jgi:hypothetical protein